jgi:hypothetical protein
LLIAPELMPAAYADIPQQVVRQSLDGDGPVAALGQPVPDLQETFGPPACGSLDALASYYADHLTLLPPAELAAGGLQDASP